MTIPVQAIIHEGQKIITTEIQALEAVRDRLGGEFALAIQKVTLLQNNHGTVILSGIGKSYFIAQKISASLASTGTPSIALHPVDALHGDLGRIRKHDVVIILSNSGTSAEIVDFVGALSSLDVTKIAITCQKESALAKLCDIVLDLGPLHEAGSLALAPTTSSTAMLALGDAITLCVAQYIGFSVEAFKQLHPKGSLGRRLRQVKDAMRPVSQIATAAARDSILTVLGAITRFKAGAACIVNQEQQLLGIFTDGDLRRILYQNRAALDEPVLSYMTKNPKILQEQMSLEHALEALQMHKIDEMPVVNSNDILVGLLDIQDIL